VQEATPLATAGTLRLLYLCWAAADPTCVQRLSRILSFDIILLQCTVDHVPPADHERCSKSTGSFELLKSSRLHISVSEQYVIQMSKLKFSI